MNQHEPFTGLPLSPFRRSCFSLAARRLVTGRSRKVTFFAALLAFLPSIALAEIVLWGIDDAVAAARSSDANLRQLELDAAGVEEQRASRWNLFQPSLSASASLSRSLFQGEGQSEGDAWSAGVGASAGVSLPTAVGERYEQRDIAVEQARLDLRTATLSLDREVREAFYAAIIAEQRLEIAVQSVALAEARLDQTEQLFEDGRVSELEVTEARSTALGRQPEVLNARGSVASAFSELKALTGLEPDINLEIHGSPEFDFDGFDRQQLRQRIVAGSPAVQSAQLSLAAARTEREITRRSSYAPSLSSSLSYSPSINPAFDGDAWSDRDTWRTGSLSFSLSIPIDPHLRGSSEGNAIRSADRSIERQEIALDQARRDVRNRAYELIEVLELSLESLEVLERTIEIDRRRYDLTRAAFEDGGADLLDVENAQVDLESRELALVEQRSSVLSTLFEIDALAGGTILTEFSYDTIFD